MGSRFSYPTNACNYHCSVCMATGKVPNIAGRFHLINETQCKCNGCQTVFVQDKKTNHIFQMGSNKSEEAKQICHAAGLNSRSKTIELDNPRAFVVPTAIHIKSQLLGIP
jgi:ribosomal 30S subunit maturation factor RimM